MSEINKNCKCQARNEFDCKCPDTEWSCKDCKDKEGLIRKLEHELLMIQLALDIRGADSVDKVHKRIEKYFNEKKECILRYDGFLGPIQKTFRNKYELEYWCKEVGRKDLISKAMIKGEK
jgi:hypothetical protein